MGPQVQTLAQSMAMLEPAYGEQRALINEQIQGLGAASQVKRDRLDAAKVDAFNTVNDQALGRGVGAAFSGVPLHEQTKYLSTQYLPGIKDIELQEGAERMQLRGTLAQLNTQQNTAALSRIDQQQAALNQWNLQQAQLEAQRREAELDRIFQREERIAGQKFTASQNAAAAAVKAPTSVVLSELFKGYKPAYAGGQKYYTEDYIIPTLMDQQGMSRADAANAVYEYRHKVFGEGRGK